MSSISNGLVILSSPTNQSYPSHNSSKIPTRTSVCGEPLSGLNDVGVVELFETDERAVIILDLTKAEGTAPVYENPKSKALGIFSFEGMSNDTPIATKDGYMTFLKWAAGREHGEETSNLYCGFRWSRQTLRKKWRIVAGITARISNVGEGKPFRRRPQIPPKKIQTMPNLKIDSLQTNLVYNSEFEAGQCQRASETLTPSAQETYAVNGPHDLFALELQQTQSRNIHYLLNFDWEATELGPISSWPSDVRRMCNFLMTDPRPAGICWGMNKLLMYNEAYMEMTGWQYLHKVGQPVLEAWSEDNDKFQQLFDEAYQSGKASVVEDFMTIERNGYLEDIYYTLTCVPFGTVRPPYIAYYTHVYEKTRQVVAYRRMVFLLHLGRETASSGQPKDFWKQLLCSLEPYHPDLPYALLYSVGETHDGSPPYNLVRKRIVDSWVLEGAIRVPNFEQYAPKEIRHGREHEVLLSNFDEILNSENATILSKEDGTFPHLLAQAFEDSTVTISDGAAFIPIRSNKDEVLGFLIVGLGFQWRFEDDFELFIELLGRQLTTSMAAATVVEDEFRRSQVASKQAAEDRNRLSRALEIQTHEAVELGQRFRKMADLAPVAMYHVAADGSLLYANEAYYQLTEHPRDDSSPMSWLWSIHELDRDFIQKQWDKLYLGETVLCELRMKKPFILDKEFDNEGIEPLTWIINAAYPERADDGTIIGVLGCLTDISRQKWAEGFQKRKMLEAIELKRQQENFIDMTSHEMRNPLSAIIQCADMIGSSITGFGDGDNDVIMPREAISSFAEAASTITLCAQHQKRIIDDILMLSKLDSDLFFITPIEVQPLLLVNNALRMFDGELRNNDVALNSSVDSSFEDLEIDWLKFDPSRMLQVIINLLTNAIKFTQSQKKRSISITVSASLEPPSDKSGIVYLKRNPERKESGLDEEWGDGEVVYLNIAVQDSGRGLDEHEQRLLFQRFSQASPRTHVQYGGSGLGLFISRELTELQGGQIGLASTSGVGSTFAFYIRTRRCARPEGQIILPSMDQTHWQRISQSTPNNKESRSDSSSSNGIPQPVITPKPSKHILIVEDNVVNQKVLSKQLQNVGCVVSVANHGLEALSFLETSSFSTNLPHGTLATKCDIVLMDLEMPVMDGLTCVKEIRNWEKNGKVKGRVPVIALTANARSEQIARAKEAGMDSVVTKPFRISELVPELEKWIALGINSSLNL